MRLIATVLLLFILASSANSVHGQGPTDTPTDVPTATETPTPTETPTVTPTATVTPGYSATVVLPSGQIGIVSYTADAGELVIVAFLVLIAMMSGVQLYLGIRNAHR